jgi:hypothetical protein
MQALIVLATVTALDSAAVVCVASFVALEPGPASTRGDTPLNGTARALLLLAALGASCLAASTLAQSPGLDFMDRCRPDGSGHLRRR